MEQIQYQALTRKSIKVTMLIITIHNQGLALISMIVQATILPVTQLVVSMASTLTTAYLVLFMIITEMFIMLSSIET